jgi:integration host factor subunit beta
MSLHGIADIELVISVVLNAIKERLTVGERVELRGFGSFYTSYREPRLGRNPRTGLRLAVSGKWVPHFKAGKEMRKGVMSCIETNALPTSRSLPRACQARVA